MITNSSDMISVLGKSLDAYYLRGEVISHNIANDDTPLYKRKDVKFEEVMKDALNNNSSSNIGNRQNKRYIANQSGNKLGDSIVDNIKLETYTQESNSKYRIDGNNVDIDNEMSELAKNQMRYSVALSQLNKQFSSLRTAMRK